MTDRRLLPTRTPSCPRWRPSTVTSRRHRRRRDAGQAAGLRDLRRRWGGPYRRSCPGRASPRAPSSYAVTVYDPRTRRRRAGSGTGRCANIPATVTELPRDAGNKDNPQLPDGAVQLRNDGGFAGFVGCRHRPGPRPTPVLRRGHAVDVPESLDVGATAPASSASTCSSTRSAGRS